jgi:hypothetical protein
VGLYLTFVHWLPWAAGSEAILPRPFPGSCVLRQCSRTGEQYDENHSTSIICLGFGN